MREADPRAGPLHADTWAALERRSARAGDKAIVMINRRGFAPWLTCRSCGHHWGCPNCDVSLIVHRDGGPPRLPPLRPRRAGCRAPARTAARRRSRGPAPGPSGSRRCWPSDLAPMPVFRLDADTAAGRGGHARDPRPRSARPPSGVLVGTQMVAKGHDFPEVTLSAILDADATLRFPDFRAEERTFALVAQLAGRSGRGEARRRGDRPDPRPERAEHRARRRATTPPASSRASSSAAATLALPAVRAPDPDRALGADDGARCEAAAEALASGARPRACPTGAELLGPAPLFRRPRTATAAGS